MDADPSSYRDPSGTVYTVPDGRILRTVAKEARENFEFVERSGVIEALQGSGELTRYRLVDPAMFPLPLSKAAYILDHEVIPFVSYPYEWCFSMLQAAALHHLDLHIHCLKHNVTLSDASAYNIQFKGTSPCFIDRLSLIPYHEAMPWYGHRQFCEQFLAPLLWQAYGGIPFQPAYRGNIDGIALATLPRLVSTWVKCSLRYQIHIGLPLKLQNRHTDTVRKPAVPKQTTLYLLNQLRRWIATLEARQPHSNWQHYTSSSCPYVAEARQKKRDTIADIINAAHPKMLWDMGANDGEYTRLAVQNGAQYAVSFESDLPVLEKAYQAARANRLPILPLGMDICSPSPNQGWRQAERHGLQKRANADYVLALALIHHLVIGRSIPLADALKWLVGLAPQGIIEWVDPTDPFVQRMLSTHTRRFEEYDEMAFTALLSTNARIVQTVKLSEGRKLYVYDRR